MPLSEGGKGLVGSVLEEKGDWIIEPVADKGVVAVEMTDRVGGNTGTGGIVTRRSGDLAFTGLVTVVGAGRAGGTRLTGGGLMTVGDG